MPTATKRIISIYLWLHLALMVEKSLIICLPVSFVLYGGIQAVVLLTMLNKKPGDAMSVTRRWVIYLLTAMEVTYTIELLVIGDFLFQDVLGIGVLPWDYLKGTIFTNPEFFHVMPGVSLTVLYLALAAIWFIIYTIRRLTRSK
ncbi:MAG: hypothetical protein IKJ58_09975 [Akkermansia sp.]|nr:hypothetical protein [Akkermansia sp.]